MTATKGWAALPFELQLIVASLLDRNDLKCLRSIHSRHGLAATAVLFSTMHIRPDTRSFARALQVAQKDNLASHVRRLVYHATIVEDHDEEMSNPLSDYGVGPVDRSSFIESIPEWYREAIEARIAYVEDNQECYWEAMKAQRAFTELDELEELSRSTSRLNNLESIATVRDQLEGGIEHPTGLRATDFFEGRPFASLFEATASLPIKRLHGELVPWDIFADVNALSDTTL